MTIWTKWLPESGYEAVDAPYLENYGEEFDGRTGRPKWTAVAPVKFAPVMMTVAPPAQEDTHDRGRSAVHAGSFAWV